MLRLIINRIYLDDNNEDGIHKLSPSLDDFLATLTQIKEVNCEMEMDEDSIKKILLSR